MRPIAPVQSVSRVHAQPAWPPQPLLLPPLCGVVFVAAPVDDDAADDVDEVDVTGSHDAQPALLQLLLAASASAPQPLVVAWAHAA